SLQIAFLCLMRAKASGQKRHSIGKRKIGSISRCSDSLKRPSLSSGASESDGHTESVRLSAAQRHEFDTYGRIYLKHLASRRESACRWVDIENNDIVAVLVSHK